MPLPTAKQSLPRGWWFLAWFVGWALVGGAVGAITADLSYTPSDAPLDFGGRGFDVAVGGGLGLIIGLGVAFITCLTFIVYRMYGPDSTDGQG